MTMVIRKPKEIKKGKLSNKPRRHSHAFALQKSGFCLHFQAEKSAISSFAAIIFIIIIQA